MADSSEPLLVINFKTYLESTGKRAVELAKKTESIGESEGVKMAVAPQFCDIERVAAAVSIPVYAQHIDAVSPGAFTGHILAESVKAAGADGTLINHSERQLLLKDIEKSIQLAKSVGLATVVCAGTARMAAAVSIPEPDIVAIEPPELIGSGRAVSKENPEIIRDSVRRIRTVNPKVKFLCGAGVTTGDDVYAALKLGSEGILVASGVVKAPKPEDVLSDFCKGVRKLG